LLQVCNDNRYGFIIAIFHRHIQQFSGVLQTCIQIFNGFNYAFQAGALLTQLLRAFGIIPYIGLFQLTADFG
jgi:hypothetical protein